MGECRTGTAQGGYNTRCIRIQPLLCVRGNRADVPRHGRYELQHGLENVALRVARLDDVEHGENAHCREPHGVICQKAAGAYPAPMSVVCGGYGRRVREAHRRPQPKTALVGKASPAPCGAGRKRSGLKRCGEWNVFSSRVMLLVRGLFRLSVNHRSGGRGSTDAPGVGDHGCAGGDVHPAVLVGGDGLVWYAEGQDRVPSAALQ